MAQQKLEKQQCIMRTFVLTWQLGTDGFTYTPAAPPGHANVCMNVLTDTPESLAEPWSVMRLGRPGIACVVRYQTA